MQSSHNGSYTSLLPEERLLAGKEGVDVILSYRLGLLRASTVSLQLSCFVNV